MSETPPFDFGGPVVWRPDAATIAASRLSAFMASHGLSDYASLHRRSVADPDWFWGAVLNDLGVRWRVPYKAVRDGSRGPAWTRWCVGGQLNITETCLDRWLDAPPTAAAPAVVAVSEHGAVQTRSYGELHDEVCALAAGLRGLGLGVGDVVGLYLPMVPATAVALLAVNRIGGVALPLFSGYAAAAVAARLADAGAKALITADGYTRRGRVVTMKATADAAVAQVASLAHVVVVSVLGDGAGQAVPMTAGRDVPYAEVIAAGRAAHAAQGAGAAEVLPAEATALLIYTSGTTGRPKGVVHSQIGFPVKAAADMVHGLDLHPGERLAWVTDLGWMMGPWLIYGCAINAATMVFIDGAPDWPDAGRLWRAAQAAGVSHLGVSPTLVRALSVHGPDPVATADLPSLRCLASTGEPWTPAAWHWLFETVGRRRVPIINYSGGTEISGGIVMGHVLAPLKACSFAGPLPGMDADVFDPQGRPVRGAVGELVIRQPWIGMARGFHNDPDRYEQTYWSRWPGLWTHGDWAAVDTDGLWYIVGRSDDTIKVAGKRLGPAEVESLLTADPDVAEAVAVGLPDELRGQTLGCFVVARGPLTDPGDPAARQALRHRLAERVVAELGKPLRPGVVALVEELPKTRNAKIMRRLVRAAWLGEELGDTAALDNPSALTAIAQARAANPPL